MDDSAGAKVGVSQIGLVGLAVMGQVGVACALVLIACKIARPPST